MSSLKPFAVLAVAVLVAAAARTPLSADRLAHTFSIVARDEATGEMGVAVQSHASRSVRLSPGAKRASAWWRRSRSLIPVTACAASS